ncbi:MAG: DUF2782 domain-containing protein [Gammaproteobacteria bacterium]|nr:DUF2782 domain-containing protein [Gammaproteobacteria bacterium]
MKTSRVWSALSAFAALIVFLVQAAWAAAPAPVIPESRPGTTPQMLDEEPEVTIVPRGSDVIEEYRIQGRLYMIRVIPSRGVPYFLVDTDGDGDLETRRNELTEDLLIPSWTLFRW